jgi:hypothetical protein
MRGFQVLGQLSPSSDQLGESPAPKNVVERAVVLIGYLNGLDFYFLILDF